MFVVFVCMYVCMYVCVCVCFLSGLLSMVIEPYLERVPDIMMVPVSISYERTLKELLFARELLDDPIFGRGHHRAAQRRGG